MVEQLQIFISHHHKDAGALTKLKEKLASYKTTAFVAHVDIELGENYLDKIKGKLEESDLFLLAGTQHAKESSCVNQEIGYALATKKGIILTFQEGLSEWGLIPQKQGIVFTNSSQFVEEEFFERLLQQIGNLTAKDHYIKRKISALSDLKIDGFSKETVANRWMIETSNHNDYGFHTSCTLKNTSGEIVTELKIAHKEMPDSENYTLKRNWPSEKCNANDFLKDEFSLLSEDFFSRVIEFPGTLSSKQQAAIRCLFNDINTNEEIKSAYKNKTVIEASLCRHN